VFTDVALNSLMERLRDELMRRPASPSSCNVADTPATTAELFALWRAVGEMSPDPGIGLKLGAEPRFERYQPSAIAAGPSAMLISGSTVPGVSSGQMIQKLERLARQLLPEGFSIEWTDLTYQQIIAGHTIVSIFPLCVVFAFLVPAARYESSGLPLAMILIVPMCLLGAIGGVWLMRGMPVRSQSSIQRSFRL
jgi:AcrB/AcrD/AcrF family